VYGDVVTDEMTIARMKVAQLALQSNGAQAGAHIALSCWFSGGRGRNRTYNQTYFQQHAGQRMTPETMKSISNPINRAQFSTSSVQILSQIICKYHDLCRDR
jgi:hypothetical protein